MASSSFNFGGTTVNVQAPQTEATSRINQKVVAQLTAKKLELSGVNPSTTMGIADYGYGPLSFEDAKQLAAEVKVSNERLAGWFINQMESAPDNAFGNAQHNSEFGKM